MKSLGEFDSFTISKKKYENTTTTTTKNKQPKQKQSENTAEQKGAEIAAISDVSLDFAAVALGLSEIRRKTQSCRKMRMTVLKNAYRLLTLM